MSERRRLRVADIAQKIAIGPFGSRMKSDTYTDAGVPVIRGTNLTGGRSFSGDWVFVAEETADELANCNVTAGDLVFPHRGAIGEVGIVPGDRDRYLLSTSLMMFRCDPTRAYSSYLYYFFKSHAGRHELLKNSSQVGTPGIGQPLTSLRGIEVTLPSLAEQRTIAHILSTLDDKIELNRRLNETLEAMARAIFKSWFVDFDPVRAKASGEPPESICRRLGLTPDVLALFPDSFQDSELGEIPAGWLVSTLGAHIEIHDSKRVPLSNREREERQGPYPYYGAAALMDHVDGYLFDGVHILMGEDGSVTNPSGTPVMQYVWGRFWVNNHAHVLTAKSPMANEHLLLLLRDLNIAAFVTGAVQAKLSQGNLRRIPILESPANLNGVFGQRIAPLFAAMRELNMQMKTLSDTRDSLLPRLLTGELPTTQGGH